MGKTNLTTKNIISIMIAFAVTFFIVSLPIPENIKTLGNATLTPAGKSTMAVLVFALILWMTEALPFHITGFLGIVMMTLFHVDSFKTIVKEGFGNHVFVFFIGVLILSEFITKTGLGKRISMFILSLTGNNPKKIILGFIITGTLLSMWVTDMAVAAMLMPLGRAILQEEGLKPLKSNFGKALMIACAWGPILGGIGTPAGCGPNPIAMGFMAEAGIHVTFLDWMSYGVPAALLLILPTWWILLLFFPPEIKQLSKSKDELKQEFKDLPKMSRDEIVTLIIFLLTVTLWMTTPLLEKISGIKIPISLPVFFTACVFFFPKVTSIKWKDVESDLSWSGMLLVVSGISLGVMLSKTGAAAWVSIALLGWLGAVHPFIQVLAVVFIVSLLKIAFSSNTVTATIIIPIILALAQTIAAQKGLSPEQTKLFAIAITFPAAITSSLAFILVTSTPTNVIPYSAGYFSISDMAKAGIVNTVVSSGIVGVVIYVIGMMKGIY